MSILLSFDLQQRRELAAGSLSPLVQALRAELEPLIDRPLPIPSQKARLTRIGGRCSFDGMLLAFDPWSPHEHKCPQCHRVFVDRAHDDWWAMGAQLWVAERAAQAAALQLVADDDAMGTVARRILSELTYRYDSWPNSDNVLGPTRPFFSTYLESIWLINLCHAIALLEQHGGTDSTVLYRARREVVLPSRDLIASYHEGRSNRQVWNEVAILSASQILGDTEHFQARLNATDGLYDLIATGLLDDGTWYEGENYHLFAHRGLWYGVELLRAAGIALPAALDQRYRAGFVTPFLGVLPDDTIPSRRDSQYKVSIRQWRFAEWCEMGIAHAKATHARTDERLVATLHRLYNADETAGLAPQRRHPFSTADAERNEPAGMLSRADLSWRSLLMTTPERATSDGWSPGSVCLPNQGLAVIRRDRGQLYVALEGGHTGGGHGHPDRLALTVQRNHERWLEDPGTGSYVEQKLHWYRSTLAHAAPLVDGASQDPVPAQLLAFEDRGGAGWICKRVEDVKPGVNIQRTVVVCDGYLIDLLEWDADRVVQIDLPIARNADQVVSDNWQPADPRGAGGLEDGFDFLTDVFVDVEPGEPSSGAFFTLAGESPINVLYGSSAPAALWKAQAPGAPGHEPGPLHWLRASAAAGFIVGLWTWLQPTPGFGFSGSAFPKITHRTQDTESIHTRTDLGWHIALKAGNATSSIDLSYLSEPEVQGARIDATHHALSEHAQDAVAQTPTIHSLPKPPLSISFNLGERHYRRTEQTWLEAGSPTAFVILAADDDSLAVTFMAETGDIVVPSLQEENMLDNERRDVNASGVEVFIGPRRGAPWTSSWLAVPVSDDRTGDAALEARITPTSIGSVSLESLWDRVTLNGRKGFFMRLVIPIAVIPLRPDGTFAMEIIVNERPANRARRRGQLVLSGGGGFAYLRGDRADSKDAVTFRWPAGPESEPH